MRRPGEERSESIFFFFEILLPYLVQNGSFFIVKFCTEIIIIDPYLEPLKISYTRKEWSESKFYRGIMITVLTIIIITGPWSLIITIIIIIMVFFSCCNYYIFIIIIIILKIIIIFNIIIVEFAHICTEYSFFSAFLIFGFTYKFYPKDLNLVFFFQSI